MTTFLLNVPSNRNFGDAIAVQDLSGIHVWNFVRCSPSNQNSWVATGTIVNYTLQLYYGITVFERAENGNAVLCNYIDFAVIFQKKLYSTNFIIHWLRAGPGRKKLCGPGGKFRPGWHLYCITLAILYYNTCSFQNLRLQTYRIRKEFIINYTYF